MEDLLDGLGRAARALASPAASLRFESSTEIVTSRVSSFAVAVTWSSRSVTLIGAFSRRIAWASTGRLVARSE